MSWGRPKPNLKPEIFFRRIQDLQVLPHLKVAIYGKWETGKTYFCCSAPEPVFIHHVTCPHTDTSHLAN